VAWWHLAVSNNKIVTWQASEENAGQFVIYISFDIVIDMKSKLQLARFKCLCKWTLEIFRVSLYPVYFLGMLYGEDMNNAY
jgi:hypothetical protein